MLKSTVYLFIFLTDPNFDKNVQINKGAIIMKILETNEKHLLLSLNSIN